MRQKVFARVRTPARLGACPRGVRSRVGVKRFVLWICFCTVLISSASFQRGCWGHTRQHPGQHLPFGTVLDPVYASATSNQIVGVYGCGILTYGLEHTWPPRRFVTTSTKAADALQNVKTALAGPHFAGGRDWRQSAGALAVKGRFALMRPASPAKEARNTIHQAPPWSWVDKHVAR